VVGKTGSGKSSLLLAMCKEMEMTKGSGNVAGKIGYLEQTPWIMNDTMRANILFGREFDESYYWRVVYACALIQDMNAWPDKDMTMIGEHGINISGGQRARLALARTVYSRADVYILDDPLSAVDAQVKRHILDNVILSSGLLGNALRVVVTHTETILPFCDQIATVSDKTVSIARQVPKVYQPISGTHAYRHIASTTSNESEKAKADKGAQPVVSDAPITAKPPPPLPPTKSYLESAKYVTKVCGAYAVCSILATAAMGPISQYILDGYKISALRSNAKSNGSDNQAVIRYLLINVAKSLTNWLVTDAEMLISNKIQDGLNHKVQKRFVNGLVHAPLAFFESSSRHQTAADYESGVSDMAGVIPQFI
ncbi:hypothetical protein GGH95_003986, partial [Coemansia sp. RSA 1836]